MVAKKRGKRAAKGKPKAADEEAAGDSAEAEVTDEAVEARV